MVEEPVHRLVRAILDADRNDDEFWESSEPADNSEIRARLIELGGGKDFPDENAPARSTMEHHLVNLFRKYGTDRVLAVIKGLEVELEAMELELPCYYRQNRFNSKLNQALKTARMNEKRWARERKKRKRRGPPKR